jgi:hypothetical protein
MIVNRNVDTIKALDDQLVGARTFEEVLVIEEQKHTLRQQVSASFEEILDLARGWAFLSPTASTSQLPA